MSWLEVLAPFVPLLQTLLWCVLIAVAVALFFRQGSGILDGVRLRVEQGSPLKAGPLELGQDLRQLQYVEPSGPSTSTEAVPSSSSAESSWAEKRNKIYQDTRGVFLVHVIEPSDEPGQLYDIFVYLAGHKSENFGDVSHAEFFFGHYWGNQVFREEPTNGLIGVSTSAYGPFLCTCRVTFKDGYSVDLQRYIDFEMGRVFERQSNRALQPTRHRTRRG
jgi:hypothetical protein